MEDGRLHACFTELTSEGERVFLAKRGARFPECFRQRPAYGEGAGVYFSLQDAYDRLDRIRDRLTALPGIACTLYKDNYMENNWYLEIFSAEAGKDKGARRLQALIGADRLVAFGDNSNDLPLFAAADVACCVASGRPDARAAADVIVAGNNDDGVARYLAALRSWPERPAGFIKRRNRHADEMACQNVRQTSGGYGRRTGYAIPTAGWPGPPG